MEALKDNIIENDTLRDNYKLAEEYCIKHNNYKKRIVEQKSALRDIYFDKMPEAAFKNGQKNTSSLLIQDPFSLRTFHSIAACVMLKNGYTLEQACDPDFKEGRDKVSEELGEVAVMMSSSNPQTAKEGKKKLGNILLEGTRKIIEEPMPPLNDLKNYVDVEKPLHMTLATSLGFELFQPVKELSNLTDPADEKLLSILSLTSNSGYLGKIMQASTHHIDDLEAMKRDSPDTYEVDKLLSCTNAMKILSENNAYDHHADDKVSTISDYVNTHYQHNATNIVLPIMTPAFI